MSAVGLDGAVTGAVERLGCRYPLGSCAAHRTSWWGKTVWDFAVVASGGACADVGSQWPAEPFRCNDGLGRFRRIASRAPRGVAIVISNPVVKKAKAKVFTASIRELLDQSSKVVRSKKRNPNTAVAKLAAKGLFGRSVPRVNPASAHKGTQAKSSSITMTG